MVESIKCVVIDDEQHAIEVLETFIARTPLLQLVHKTTNPLEGFSLIQKQKVDLVFLDVQMPELSGIDLARLILPPTKLIFTTAYPDYALKGYEFNIVDYLLKPILFERFLKAIQKVSVLLSDKSDGITTISEESNDTLFIRTESRGRLIKVNISDIQYIEALGNYIFIQTKSEKLLTLITMKEAEEKLHAYSQFVRIHKSFIINKAYLKSIDSNRVFIDKKEIPIGEKYKESFLKNLNNQIL